MPSVFGDQPGLLFVVATLLPLASFVILLLAGGLRNFLRQYKHTEPCGVLFDLLGGEVTGRGPAFVGLGAIALAFFLCFYGSCLYLGEYSTYEHSKKELNEKLGDIGDHPRTDEKKKERKDTLEEFAAN